MEITDVSQIKIGSEIIDSDSQVCYLVDIIPNTNPIISIIQVQHYPNNKWYISNVRCTKCSGISKLKFTSTSAEKFICSHKIAKHIIPSGELFAIETFFTCGCKKYEEVSRRYTGIPAKSSYYWTDFIKEFTT